MTIFPLLLQCLRLALSDRASLVAENNLLRHQLASYKRRKARPVITRWDRMIWAWIWIRWSGWRDALFFVSPDTVVRWHRERFKAFWARKSQPLGRPTVPKEIRFPNSLR